LAFRKKIFLLVLREIFNSKNIQEKMTKNERFCDPFCFNVKTSLYYFTLSNNIINDYYS